MSPHSAGGGGCSAVLPQRQAGGRPWCRPLKTSTAGTAAVHSVDGGPRPLKALAPPAPQLALKESGSLCSFVDGKLD